MIYEIIGWAFPIASLACVFFVKGWKSRGVFVAGLAFAILVVRAFKIFFDVPRPEDALVLLESSRFPSTHAALSFYPLGFFFKDNRKWLLALLFALGLVGSYSRIFLQVHVFIDLFVGALIGLAVGALSYLSTGILEK